MSSHVSVGFVVGDTGVFGIKGGLERSCRSVSPERGSLECGIPRAVVGKNNTGGVIFHMPQAFVNLVVVNHYIYRSHEASHSRDPLEGC